MNGFGNRRQVECDRAVDREAQTSEDLATIRLLEQQWDEYRRVMRQNTARYEEAGSALGVENYYVQRGMAARQELDSYVGRLAREQEELLQEAAQRIRSQSEEESERARREQGGVSWV
ncbi:hypothetical protein [Leifsonia aquatica]|uniref:hypothetical protein n=1 Tax=Leifsonia aquatica TaxID=144185 RepID=UPI0038198E84